ncbi:hypothetical protein L218DRAFT_71714 [Marasmius fiardii PR-910]|nr:hypothetical protein L218DRAFT_71714 [Marasmius fiardii PR-910]
MVVEEVASGSIPSSGTLTLQLYQRVFLSTGSSTWRLDFRTSARSCRCAYVYSLFFPTRNSVSLLSSPIVFLLILLPLRCRVEEIRSIVYGLCAIVLLSAPSSPLTRLYPLLAWYSTPSYPRYGLHRWFQR